MMRTLILSTCLFVASLAQAASLDLIYTGDNQVLGDNTIVASEGDVVTFDIVLDFTGEPTLGGGFDVVFTESELDFVSYVAADFGNPAFSRDPDVEDGLLFSAAVGAFEGLEFGLVASLSFLVTGDAGFTIELESTQTFGGNWISSEDFVTPIVPEYGRVVGVSPVPLPAAVWLLLSGIFTLLGLRTTETLSH